MDLVIQISDKAILEVILKYCWFDPYSPLSWKLSLLNVSKRFFTILSQLDPPGNSPIVSTKVKQRAGVQIDDFVTHLTRSLCIWAHTKRLHLMLSRDPVTPRHIRFLPRLKHLTIDLSPCTDYSSLADLVKALNAHTFEHLGILCQAIASQTPHEYLKLLASIKNINSVILHEISIPNFNHDRFLDVVATQPLTRLIVTLTSVALKSHTVYAGGIGRLVKLTTLELFGLTVADPRGLFGQLRRIKALSTLKLIVRTPNHVLFGGAMTDYLEANTTLTDVLFQPVCAPHRLLATVLPTKSNLSHLAISVGANTFGDALATPFCHTSLRVLHLTFEDPQHIPLPRLIPFAAFTHVPNLTTLVLKSDISSEEHLASLASFITVNRTLTLLHFATSNATNMNKDTVALFSSAFEQNNSLLKLSFAVVGSCRKPIYNLIETFGKSRSILCLLLPVFISDNASDMAAARYAFPHIVERNNFVHCYRSYATKASGEIPIKFPKTKFETYLCDGPALQTTTNKEELMTFFTDMTRMRRIEITADALYKKKLIRGFCHLYNGQEAVCTGMEASITKEDHVITAYRDHTFMLSRGSTPEAVLAELLMKSTGCSKGKGGSMHMFTRNFYGGNGIVGAQCPVGAGLAFAQKYNKTGNVALTYYGDGAANQGQLYEAFNMAKLWDLPCIFICENNGFAMGTSMKRGTAGKDFFSRAHYIPGIRVDGMDVLAVKAAGKWAVDMCRAGKGPIVMEMDTYRYVGHSMSDPGTSYRTRDEVNEVRAIRDPIEHVRKLILENKCATEDELTAIEDAARTEMDAAAEFAIASPMPEMGELWTNVYKEAVPIRAVEACDSFRP
eukprot:gene7446-8712_t